MSLKVQLREHTATCHSFGMQVLPPSLLDAEVEVPSPTSVLIPHSNPSPTQQEQESTTIQRSETAAMNWMTSGRHRALGTRNARKKRLQMQLPAHVQQESERRRLQSQQQQASYTTQPQLPLPSTLRMSNHQAARGEDHAAAKTPWYILPVNDADESQGLDLSLVNVVDMEKGCAPLILTYRMFVGACRYQDAGIWAKSHLRKDGHNGASGADSAA